MTSLYIHIPFCSKKCLFCSFVIAVGQGHNVDHYLDALALESARYQGTRVSSVYLGGGTPTFLSEAQLGRLIEHVRRTFHCPDGIEWTIEGNPEGLDAAKAKFLKKAGINRFSLGVQSLDDRYLKFLGRAHDRSSALKAYDHLRETGFDRISLDLMYAFPGQTQEEIIADTTAIAAMQSEHLSLYTLTVEEHSRFYAQSMKLDEDSRLAEHYQLVCDVLRGSGVRQYEVSNFCRGSNESAHNRHYWEGGEYIGLGVGAHGHLQGRRMWNVSKLQDYFKRIHETGDAVEGYEDLTPQTRLAERLIFGLRMNEGVIVADIERATGAALRQEQRDAIERFVNDRFLSLDGQRLKATDQGRLVLDELSSRLI